MCPNNDGNFRYFFLRFEVACFMGLFQISTACNNHDTAKSYLSPNNMMRYKCFCPNYFLRITTWNVYKSVFLSNDLRGD